MRRTFPLLALVLLALPLALSAQHITLSTATPEDAGMSAEVLEAGLALYEKAVADGDLVGAVVLVARNGKIVMHEALGWRNKAQGLPMEPNTLFRMASNTKPVIATALSMQVEERKIDYSDNVRAYFPTWDNYRAGFINVGHLLSHTSGLRINTLFLTPLMKPSAQYPDAPTLQLEVARFGEVGAEVEPGTTYSYSNPGFNTLGALIERTSGTPLEVFLRQRIYAPLAMDDSYHHEVAEELDGKLDRMGVVYYGRSGDEWTPGWTPGDPPQAPFVRASGGMISTAWDYAIFLQMFLNGGTYDGHRIISPETVAVLTSPKTDPIGGSEGNRSYYGYGWQVRDDGSFSHGGSDGTNAFADPATGVIGIVFTQTPGGRNPIRRFRELVGLAVAN